MKRRWASDIAAGFLVAAIGAVLTAGALFFAPPLTPIALGVLALGAAVGLFGGFEYFASVVNANRDENSRT